MLLEIIIASFLLVVLTILASIDMAFSRLSDVSLRILSSESQIKRSKAAFLEEIADNRPRFRFALSSAIQFLLIVFSVLVVLIVYSFTSESREMLLYSLVVGLGLSVLFRQILPRLINWRNPEAVLLSLMPLVRPLYSILPLIGDPLDPSIERNGNRDRDKTITPDDSDENGGDDDSDDIQALIEVGEAEGIIEEGERELIETMIEFGDTEVDEIMTPRTEIVGIEIESTIEEVRDLMLEEKFSRLPVYRSNIDNIEGLVYVRDILSAWAEGKESSPIEPILRDAFFVPETKLVAELLENMRKSHVQISIVIDEYGGVAGLVSVEDILEEIVGEIEDEDQEDQIVEIAQDSDGYSLTAGSTEIGKIEKHFDIEIEDDDFTTIAGLITSEAGYVPTKGEKLEIRGLEIEILKADGKKIQALRMKVTSGKSK